MWVWRKRVRPEEAETIAKSVGQFPRAAPVLIDAPGKVLIVVEVASSRKSDLEKLRRHFGGRIARLPRSWATPDAKVRPLRIGRKLAILRRPDAGAAGSRKTLIIPAGAAFGTGDHATTAMSLRLLAEVAPTLRKNWSLLDLGTGSGIFALAARRLGAGTVRAIDFDPSAIATARENARRNNIRGIAFQIADIRALEFPYRIDLVTANLFSELLRKILPRLREAHRVILSGVLANQEDDLRRALRFHRFEIMVRRRRGKWIALLVRPAKSGKKRVDGG